MVKIFSWTEHRNRLLIQDFLKAWKGQDEGAIIKADNALSDRAWQIGPFQALGWTCLPDIGHPGDSILHNDSDPEILELARQDWDDYLSSL